MRSNRRYSESELEFFIKLYLEGISFRELQDNYNLQLSERPFRRYVRKYQTYGLVGLNSNTGTNRYSAAFKQGVVNEFLTTTSYSYDDLAIKYNIPSPTTVRNWVKQYTEGKQLKDYSPKPEVYNMKSEKKTHEEKVEIVRDFLDTGMNYRQTAEKHGISYNNVYVWVQKYKKHGPDGLIDSRGRRKPSHIQTLEEQQVTEIAALKARNEFLETENAALKKLKEVERELILQEQNIKLNFKQ